MLAKKKKKDHMVLVRITGHVTDDEAEAATDFAKLLMEAAYRGAWMIYYTADIRFTPDGRR